MIYLIPRHNKQYVWVWLKQIESFFVASIIIPDTIKHHPDIHIRSILFYDNYIWIQPIVIIPFFCNFTPFFFTTSHLFSTTKPSFLLFFSLFSQLFFPHSFPLLPPLLAPTIPTITHIFPLYTCHDTISLNKKIPHTPLH